MSVPALGRVLAVSAHLDDAVLSAGALLSAHRGSFVLTVFAGIPAHYEGLSEWDARSGFAGGDDVVALRREEDRRAAERVGATVEWLDFLDNQYSERQSGAAEIAAAIRVARGRLDADTLALPLGLAHADHVRTHEACALLLEHEFDFVTHWVAWADIPYRARHPDLMNDRLDDLRAKGFVLSPFEVEAGEPKRAALAEYPSQLRALGPDNMADAERPEQLYTITRQ